METSQVEVDFDTEYHFPTRIRFNALYVEDEQFFMDVISFEPLP